MGKITVEHVCEAPLDRVYAVAKDVERFGEIMPDMESVEILERDGSSTLTRWVGVIKQFNRKIRWIERDDWDDEAHVCTFHQTEGDYEVYQGVWKFEATESGGSKMTIDLEVEINVPLIGSLLKSLINKLTRLNAERMLEAIAEEAAR